MCRFFNLLLLTLRFFFGVRWVFAGSRCLTSLKLGQIPGFRWFNELNGRSWRIKEEKAGEEREVREGIEWQHGLFAICCSIRLVELKSHSAAAAANFFLLCFRDLQFYLGAPKMLCLMWQNKKFSLARQQYHHKTCTKVNSSQKLV